MFLSISARNKPVSRFKISESDSVILISFVGGQGRIYLIRDQRVMI